MGGRLTSSVQETVTASALRARQTLWVTQSFFFAALAVCLVIYHGHVVDTDGISFFGVYPPTMPVLFAGYLGGAGGLWWASSQLVDAGAPAWLRPGLRWIAGGLVVLLATPYNQGTFFNWAHMVTGVSMGAVQVAIAVAAIGRRPHFMSIAAFVLLVTGGVVSAISLPDWNIALNLQGEVMLELGFAWSLLEWTHALGARAA